MSKNKNPVLITGAHRSGTTWVGKMLSAAPRTAYLHEPFNKDINIRVSSAIFPHTFERFDMSNSKKFERSYHDILEFRYPLACNIKKTKSLRDAAKIIRDQVLFLKYKALFSRPILKDPFTLFSVEWLHENFSMDVLVMIRHPAAFCSSLKLKNWNFDFSNFLDQPDLMNGYLEGYSSEIIAQSENTHDIIDQGILLWNCIYHTIQCYQKDHPDWLFVKHEDLSKDPVSGFNALYDQLGLEFTDKAKLRILKSSGAHNPVEQKPGREFVRNSIGNIDNWRTRLNKSEIERIKYKTSEISGTFYSEDDW